MDRDTPNAFHVRLPQRIVRSMVSIAALLMLTFAAPTLPNLYACHSATTASDEPSSQVSGVKCWLLDPKEDPLPQANWGS